MNNSPSYSVVVILDIHGNVAALNAVFGDLKNQPFDRLVVAGDLVLSGPRPVESLELIQAPFGESSALRIQQAKFRPILQSKVTFG